MNPYPEPSDLDTGNNIRKQEQLTNRVLAELVGEYGYTPLGCLKDAVGVFARTLKAPDGTRIYLLIKGSYVWRDLLSCQAFLPNQAATEKAPILLAYANESDIPIEYYLYNPAAIVETNLGFNNRLGVKFVNFNFSSGVRFNPKMQSVHVAFKKAFGKVIQYTLKGDFC